MLSENYRFAFIDECGNFGYDFDNEGTSTHFVITAVIVEPNKIIQLNESLSQISIDFFNGSEIKSRSVGSDDIRRIRIIENINKLDYSIICFVIDKRKVYPDSGMRYKESFIKYANKILHNRLKRIYPSLKIIHDQHGSIEFMESCIKYFEKQDLELFCPYDFEFKDSKESLLVQLSDFICGTIARGYIRDKSSKYDVFVNLLKDRLLEKNDFPIEYSSYSVNKELSESPVYDDNIAEFCLRSALRFIENYQNSSVSEEQDQSIVLNYLLFQLQTDNSSRYINSRTLIRHLQAFQGRKYSNREFKTKIIAKLRDKEVIISSSKHGYKIPINLEEIHLYTSKTIQVVIPMLERLMKCRESILALTDRQLDIMDKEEYNDIRAYCDYLMKKRLGVTEK